MSGFKYGYECDICGGDFMDQKQPAPPESLHTPEGHFQACPRCARMEHERQRLLKAEQEKKPMPTPEELDAAAVRMSEIAARKRKPAPEPEYEDAYEPEYEDEYEPEPVRRPPPAARDRQVARERLQQRRVPPPRPKRSRLAEAMERLEVAIDSFEAAEAELLEAHELYDSVKEEYDDRRSRILERYNTAKPATNARKPTTATKRRR